MDPAPHLLPALERYWGYASFRPLQERIVHSLLAGHDTCVVMPTGGGKSLCYQLPAALTPGKTAMVISPLIALMHDQMAQLAQMGIAAAVLNSTMPAGEQSRVQRDAAEGRFRLLYLSPERLARNDTSEWLARVPLAFFVVDEAHCISEWGHEFRPEYRQLSNLRAQFPNTPIAAFTASATRRVRHDIIEQLRLRDPHKYIASFHRPNLRYVVRECDSRAQRSLLLRALRGYPAGNVIVYAPTIARVEETVDLLEEGGLPAVPYHGQMDNDTRRRNQERWMCDDVRILVGTIAFGLGIDKAAVRAVIHLSLPKSVEQYYQEAGRAGRDAQPADCLLLWQKRDVGLLAHFIGQINDAGEKERAWQRYHEIRRFVDSLRCRHLQICTHFGETPKWKTCGACDVCGYVPDSLSAAEPEPAAAPAARAGRRKPRTERPAPSAKRDTLSPNTPITSADTELRDYLREWRRATAKQQHVPAYVVMHDTTLDDLCVRRPRTLSEIRRVFGFGEVKSERYGRQVLAALQEFHRGARASGSSRERAKPHDETLRLLREGHSLEEIARIRDRRLHTVVAMVADMVESGEVEFQPAWIDPGKLSSIEAACAHVGFDRLRALKDALPPEITYDEIRLVVARFRYAQPS